MIRYIKGKVTEKDINSIIVEHEGIGFLVNVSENSPLMFSAENEEVTVYTFMAVKEDDISLYGFASMSELKMFNQLITVSGIGSKGAMNILSKLTVAEIKQACAFDDADVICKAPGIGKKTAQRIILELKDKLAKDLSIDDQQPATPVNTINSNAKEQALGALQNLGFTKSEAMVFLSGITDNNLTTEEYIKLALRSKR